MLATLSLIFFLLPGGQACTLIAVGKGATVDGSTLLAHTDDAGGGASDTRLVRVPPMDHKHGAMRPVYACDNGNPRVVTRHRGPYYEPVDGQEVTKPVGYIPQVRHTYGYYDHDYGLVNEVGLAMAETTVSSRTFGWSTRFPWGHSMFNIEELSKIGLERCATARCAIQTMGDLAVEHGFYTNYTGHPLHPYLFDSAEVLGITDSTGEVWLFHLLTGDYNRSAVWAAQRVPDGHIAVVPNTMVIREIDFNDPDNFMWSPNVRSVALRNGWWKPEDGPFDFARAYVVSDPVPLIPLYVGRRMWRIYSIVAPSIKMDPYMGYMVIRPTYPFSIPPDNKISSRQIMDILKDYFEDTEFDLTKGLAAAPWGNPVRFAGYYGWNSTEPFPGSWERSISIYRAVYSMVIAVRQDMPDSMSAILWFGQDAPHGTVWVPFYCGQSTVPPPYIAGKQSQFSFKSAYWAFNLVNNWSYQMWRLIHAEVVKEQQRLQKLAFALVEELDKNARNASFHHLMRNVERRQTDFAEYVISEWWDLAFRLIAKYNNGYVCTSERVKKQVAWGYPIWWLQAVGYDQWPGRTYEPLLPPGAGAIPVKKVAKVAKQSTSMSLGRKLAMVVLGASGAFAFMGFTGRLPRNYQGLP